MILGIIKKDNTIILGDCVISKIIISYNETITISCNDVIATTKDRIICLCDNCNKKFTTTKRYFISKKLVENQVCRSCSIKETSLERYGVESPNQDKDIKKKQQRKIKKIKIIVPKRNSIEYRDNLSKKLKETFSTIQYKEIRSNNAKEKWKDPVYREKVTNSVKKAKSSAEARLNMSNKIKNLWKDSSYRNRQIDIIKERWKDPIYKEKMSKVGIRISSFQLNVYNYYYNLDNNWKLEEPLTSTGFTVDLYNPITNEIIECYGDYWHCNPIKYKEDYFNSRLHKMAKEVWDHDANRIKILTDLGYKIEIIWETAWREFLKDDKIKWKWK